MKLYNGVPCTHCRKLFNDSDDIVVCPDCGAPYHRACYQEAGRCELEEKHAPDFSWKPPVAQKVAAGETVTCPNCNTVNPKASSFCQMCGSRLGDAPLGERELFGGRVKLPGGSAGETAQRRVEAVDQWEINGVSAHELSAFVGSGAYYFLRQFQLLLNAPGKISWNWCAFFFGPFYFFYRKMYGYGAAILSFYLFSTAYSIPAAIPQLREMAPQLFADFPPEMLASSIVISLIFGNLVNILTAAVCALFANKLYLRKAILTVGQMRASFAERVGSRDYYSALYYKGNVNILAVVLALMITSFAISGLGYFAATLI
ncbi:MAG TPA: DUF2628 domain-containing protein [Candidatus Fimivivens faecavium]|nr:DUF2628 domain-containing protein [Candidatus Fimivivens faecavium]